MSLVQNIWDSVAGRAPDDADVMEKSQQFIRWASLPSHQYFLDYLYENGDAPVDIRSDHQNLLAMTARANTFKEIRRYLVDQETRANRLLDRENRGN